MPSNKTPQIIWLANGRLIKSGQLYDADHKNICRASKGNVALITALLTPILMLFAGFAVDYGYSSYIKHGLDDALDAAVLASVSQATASTGGGYDDTAWLKAYGNNVFQGNIAKLPISGATATITVTPNGTGGVVANGSYTYPVPTFFAGVIGMSTISVAGKAQASSNPITYITYYILVDTSQSMGVAATSVDMTNLYARVKAYGNGSGGEVGCTFGCHVKTGSQPYTNEYLAHNISPKITLRIDAAISAIQNIISLAQTNSGSLQNIKIGIYTMSKDPVAGTLIKTISTPSSNYTNLTTLASTIELGNNTSGGIGDSDFFNQVTNFNSLVPANGTGKSAASPLNYVFIVTDGLTDTPGSCTYGHCTSAFSASFCNALKIKSTVGTIYTTYLPIYNNNNPSSGLEINYTLLVQPYVASIPGSLLNCASSKSLYFEAKDGEAISTAMNTLFSSTYQSARLQQ